MTEFWLRFNSFCFAFPILFALVLYPKAWPFCSALGVWFVTANNYFTYKLAKKIKKYMAKIPKFLRDFLDSYSAWWVVMFFYGLGLAGVGFGLLFGFLYDEWFYAIIVTLMINGKMYAYNCGKNEEMILSGLEYTFYIYRRAIKFEAFNGVRYKNDITQ